eukprot:12900945-Prorocentrum_lima.AAC.1
MLVDTSANKIIRSRNPDCWNEIIKGEKGQPVTLKLAAGAMTQYGEIMPGSRDSKSDIVWTVPVCRLTKELGMKL